MAGPTFYAASRLKRVRDGEIHVIVPGDRIDPSEFARSLKRDVSEGRIIRIEADGTAKWDSLRLAKRLGIPVKPASQGARGMNIVKKRFETRDKDGKITHVEYRRVDESGVVAQPDPGALGGAQEVEASDRPSAPESEERRRRAEPDTEPDAASAESAEAAEVASESSDTASDTGEGVDDAAGG